MTVSQAQSGYGKLSKMSFQHENTEVIHLRMWSPCMKHYNATNIMEICKLNIQEMYVQNVTFTVDLCNTNAPFIIGLYLQKYSNVDKFSDRRAITINRPNKKLPRVIKVFISLDDGLNRRLHLKIIAPFWRKSLLMIKHPVGLSKKNRRSSSLSNRLHHLTNAHIRLGDIITQSLSMDRHQI